MKPLNIIGKMTYDVAKAILRQGRLLAMTVCMLTVMGVQAQTTPAAKARVTEIRQMYAKAKAKIEQNEQSERLLIPREDMLITTFCNMPGTGPKREDIHYYFLNQADGEEMIVYFQPYFITRKYNVAAREFYEEYLYDHERRQLVFAFLRGIDIDDGKPWEVRYYWGESGLVHESGKVSEAPANDVVAKSRDLVDAFGFLMNQDR